ncbi:MAG: hypothetical protein ACRCTE_03185 [Cellulosilyticaceae bacterium]
MKRQLNLNILKDAHVLDVSLDKLIGGNHPPVNHSPILPSEPALSLSELSATLDSLCEDLLHSEEDILSAASTNDFINKYASSKALHSIDDLLAQYSTTQAAPSPSDAPLNFKDLLEGF